MAAEVTEIATDAAVASECGAADEAEADLRIEEQDVRDYRAQHYPHKMSAGATGRAPAIRYAAPPAEKHSQNRGYSPLGPT